MEALLNLNGILASGLENFGTIIADGNSKGLDHDLQWLVTNLDRIELPRTILALDPWATFCAIIAGRPLGRPLAGRA